MQELAMLLSEAVKERRAPFVVGMLGTSTETLWTGSAGEDVARVALDERTVFRIVSMTKAIGATAAAILAERGLLDWEAPVETILPEFGDLQVLESDECGEFRLRPARTKATLRQLATHTSGLVYGFWDNEVSQFSHQSGLPPVVSGLRASLRCPLRFDPGSRWQYGSGIDWLGLVVEAIDGRRIDRFCYEEILGPLHMNDTSFAVQEDMHHRLPLAFGRSQDGGFTEAPINVDPPSDPEFYGMGHALYSTTADYMRFLRFWLNHGQLEGVRLLKEESAKTLLGNQIGDLKLGLLKTALPVAVEDFSIPVGTTASHSIAFARIEQGVSGMRSEGSQFWGGVLNTHFWLDPKRDIVGILMTQLLPFLDPGFMSLLEDFERAVYAQLNRR